MTIEKLKEILQACWSKETCYPKQKENWNKNNPSLGQCAVTSLIVNDYFGVKIGKCSVGDISDEEFVTNVINDINKEGNIIGLINNAGEPSFKLPKDYVKKI